MANIIGYVDNSNGQSAHYNFFNVLREFALGYGTVSNLTYTGTGNGTLDNPKALPGAVTETWTITCTAATTDGGTFSVTGSVSGAQADATVGVLYDNGFVSFTISDGTTDFIVGDKFTFDTTQSDVSANGENWEELIYDTSGSNWKTMLRGKGLTGSENIYIGFTTYHDVANDYYNISVCMFTGYLPSETFANQPGYKYSGIPLYKDRVDYWITLNAQRIAFCCKVDVSYYTSGYVGKFFPYATPSQYPYPVALFGMLQGNTANDYTAGNFGYFGYNANDDYYDDTTTLMNYWFVTPFNTLHMPSVAPFSNRHNYLYGGTNTLIDTNGEYPLVPAEIFVDPMNDTDVEGLFGQLDGIFWISGWNNTAESTLTIGTDDYIIFKNKGNSADNQFYAMRLDK